MVAAIIGLVGVILGAAISIFLQERNRRSARKDLPASKLLDRKMDAYAEITAVLYEPAQSGNVDTLIEAIARNLPFVGDTVLLRLGTLLVDLQMCPRKDDLWVLLLDRGPDIVTEMRKDLGMKELEETIKGILGRRLKREGEPRD